MEADNLTLGIAFVAGLLSFVSPCVLPLIPAYISYMGGRMTRTVALQTAGGGTQPSANATQRATMIFHGLMFVAGFTTVFVTIGLMTTAFVRVLGGVATTGQDIIARMGGVLIIFFGLNFMGAIRRFFSFLRNNPRLLSSLISTLVIGGALSAILFWGLIEPIFILPAIAGLWLWIGLNGGLSHPATFWDNTLESIENLLYADTRRDMNASSRQGLGGSFLMGVIFSAGWTPCIGPIYGAVLGLAANQGDIARAAPLLMVYSLGLGLPFILATLLIDSLQGILRRLQRQMHTIELISGILLVTVGVLVASGQLSRLSQLLNNEFADFSLRVEKCGVGFFEGHVAFNQVGACFSGDLTLLALNEIEAGQLNATKTRIEYIVHATEATTIDIELRDVSLTEFSPQATLYDSDNNILATNATPDITANNRYVVLKAIQLPKEGLYRVVITQAEVQDVTFRVQARPTRTVAQTTPQTESTSALAGVGSISTLSNPTEAITGLEMGNVAPNFTVALLEGAEIALSDLRGQVVLINFWGTWCAPCQREMPDLQALYQTYEAQGFTILALAVRDTQSNVETFRQANALTFPMALDKDNKITKQYAIQGQPTTLLLNKDGVIIGTFYSIVTIDQLAPLIETALNS